MWRGVENTLAITSSWCTLPALQRKTTIQSCCSQPWCKNWWTSSVSWVSHPTSWEVMSSGEAEGKFLLSCLAPPAPSKPSLQLFLYLLAPDDSFLWNAGLGSLLQGENGCGSPWEELPGPRGPMGLHPSQREREFNTSPSQVESHCSSSSLTVCYGLNVCVPPPSS